MPRFEALRHRLTVLAALAVAFAACAPLEAGAPPQPPAAAQPLEPLEVVTADGRSARFSVEVADDERERARGLMFRGSLADDAGMLFVYERAQPVSFWMRNTLIPLDIIFIGANGRILNIAEMTTPYSEAPIPSAGAARWVLEIRGGRAAELGLGPGDAVRHEALPGE